MKREGRLVYEFDFHESQTNIVPKMDAGVLSAGYKKVLRSIYRPRILRERAKTMLLDYRQDPIASHENVGGWTLPLLRRYLGIVVRMVYHIGIRGEGRRNFWALVRWTLLHRPRHVDLAFFFGLWMHEFQEMYRSYDASGHFDIYKVPMALSREFEESKPFEAVALKRA